MNVTILGALVGLGATLAVGSAPRAQADPGPILEPDVLERMLEFSPLPEPPADPSNAFGLDPAAARLGQALFFEQRLSANGEVSCATCHDPDKGWADGLALGRGLKRVSRNTPGLLNVAHSRWYFWDGRKDSLWAQAMAPLEDPREHGFSRLELVHFLAGDPDYRRAYETVFGDLPEVEDRARFPERGRPVEGIENDPSHLAWMGMTPKDRHAVDRVLVNVGKAMAAFERRLASVGSPFDRFVEGLREEDPEKLGSLSPSAQRGFALFQGKALCFICHDGPFFSDLEFHDTRIPSEEGGDLGRVLGIPKVRRDPFNGLSIWADDGGARGRTQVDVLPIPRHTTREFKTPSLRNVARTAPYMHAGELETLEQVVEFYSTLEGAAPEIRGSEKILRPLGLSDQEKADLVAFLESLTGEDPPAELRAAPATPWLPGD